MYLGREEEEESNVILLGRRKEVGGGPWERTTWVKATGARWQAGWVQDPAGGTTARWAQVQQDGRQEQRVKASSDGCLDMSSRVDGPVRQGHGLGLPMGATGYGEPRVGRGHGG